MPRTTSKPKPAVIKDRSEKLLYTYAEVRSVCGCSRNTLFNWFNKGYLTRGPGRTVTAESLFNAVSGKVTP